MRRMRTMPIPGEPEKRQTGVKLDSLLLREFKVLAAERETTLGELLEEAMRDYLEKVQKEESHEEV